MGIDTSLWFGPFYLSCTSGLSTPPHMARRRLVLSGFHCQPFPPSRPHTSPRSFAPPTSSLRIIRTSLQAAGHLNLYMSIFHILALISMMCTDPDGNEKNPSRLSASMYIKISFPTPTMEAGLQLDFPLLASPASTFLQSWTRGLP